MRLNKLFACFILLLIAAPLARAQHDMHILARLNDSDKTLEVLQRVVYKNQTNHALTHLVFNDWNNAFSTKNSPLALRFSDEFTRSFYLADAFDLGHTDIRKLGGEGFDLVWSRPKNQPDLIEIALFEPLLPNDSLTLSIEYTVKLPSDKFTRYGFSSSGDYALKDWYLSPARLDQTGFVRYSNLGIDDMAESAANLTLVLETPRNFHLTSDLEEMGKTVSDARQVHVFSGANRQRSVLYLNRQPIFHSFHNNHLEVRLGFEDEKVNDIQKALIVDRIVNFTAEHIGTFPHPALVVSEADYVKNPFYGLNQLPAFISPFSDAFAFELRFLKTYLHQFLVHSMQLDPRADNWVFDGLQVYAMMQYIDLHYPGAKMMGTLSKWKLLKSFNIINLDFNEQYSYYYMLMARKNLDQPIGAPKDELIKFNAQIAGKYRAGLSLAYLDNYLGMDKVPASIREFYALAVSHQTGAGDFEHILEKRAQKDIEWFFGTVIHSRRLIDYKFVGKVEKTQDSVRLTLRNRTGTTVPIPVYGVRGKEVVFKQWIEGVSSDSTLTLPRLGADKIAINYRNEVPEYNLRNNWKSLRNFSIGNRPLKFNLMKDLEDPYYNQLLYVPHFEYNLYDGVSLGLRLHNKTILDKPFTFDVTPVFSSKKQQLIGSASVAFNQFLRDGNLYQIRYSLSGNYFHYAPDAAYLRLNPMISFRFRDEDFRLNKKQQLIVRHVLVHRDPTNFVLDDAEQNENYGVFNLRYFHTRHELVRTMNYRGDVHISQNFGKAIFTADYRKLFENNRQVNLRFFFGTFLYNQTTNDFFSFALDRPTDYLFDYNYYGRSEDTGLLSQQLILSEGGFKSKLDTPFANRWMATVNASTSVWNWIEVYADAGLVKNRFRDAAFVYDSGVRLNLVTDYFELYFPVYSNNGWEISQRAYAEKIRFIVIIDPKTLVNLFTRKWF